MTDRSSLAKRLIKDLVTSKAEICQQKGEDVVGKEPPSDGYVIMSFRDGGNAQMQRATFSDVYKSSPEALNVIKTPQLKNEDQFVAEEGSFYGEAFWIGSEDEEMSGGGRVASVVTEDSDRSSQKEEEEVGGTKMKMSRLTALSRGLLAEHCDSDDIKKVNSCTKSYLGDSRAVYYGGSEDGRKMLRCRECGKHYRNDYSLRHHICLRRKEVWKKGDVPKELVDGQVIYFCPACSKPFRWMGNLTRHFYVHTGQRFFKCDICDKEFFSAYQVRRHMNSHTGMRYKCRVCEKPFTCVYACTWHMRQHSSDSSLPSLVSGEGPPVSTVPCSAVSTTTTTTTGAPKTATLYKQQHHA